MAAVVYILGALTTLLCCVLLLRSYRHGGRRLLLWSGLCFAGLAVSNTLVFVDLVVFPDLNLYAWRLALAVISMGLLVYGLIWEGE